MTHERETQREKEERRWKVERQRRAWWLGATLIGLIAAMYIFVQPILGAFGFVIVLPEWRLVLVILSMVAAPVFGIKPASFLSVLATVLARMPHEEEDDDA